MFKNLKNLINLTMLLLLVAGLMPGVQPALAAVNLIKDGSFEGDVNQYWSLYQNDSSSREYDLYRSYDAPFGYGSYSAAIDANGSAEDAFNAILSTDQAKSSFGVDSSKSYYLVFYAKASQNLSVIFYLQRTDNYDPISDFYARDISTDWEKHVIKIDPSISTNAALAFVLGDMPNGSSFYLDGVQVFEASLSVPTNEVRGKIGSNGRFIKIKGIANFDLEDVEIELPYFDNLTGQAGTKRFSPERISSTGAYINMHKQTFSGIGRVYLADNYAGEFDYRVNTEIEQTYPVLVRADSDLTVVGTGFNPNPGQTFLVVKALDGEFNTVKRWIEPAAIDSELTMMTFKLPSGMVSGNMYVQTSFSNTAGESITIKSNEYSYKLKPLVYATNWSGRGYEHVGDNLLVYGRGLGKNPYVTYYDEDGNKLETKKASIKEIQEDVEIIEVATTKKSNNFTVVVVSEGVESDQSDSFSYIAKPKINNINGKYERKMQGSDEYIPASKAGDQIIVKGIGFNSNPADTFVEFEAVDGRISAQVAESDIAKDGRTLKVEVPAGTVNGYINVKINGTDSNYLPLEIVPTVISVNPDPVIPGGDITIRANGVKNNLNLTKVHFKLSNSKTVAVKPHAINVGIDYVEVVVKAPLALSNNDSKVSLQYDRWKDNGTSVLNVDPTITSASINLDNDVLSIKGYGFSISPKENQITYMYADEGQTVIDPKVKILGVYPSEEGQEIRVKVMERYYYGFVTVTVNGKTSNEANFGPAVISSIARRVEYVPTNGAVMGVLYINGYNFGSEGEVLVGGRTAQIHYRSDFFIIAVIDQAYLNDNPVVVTRSGDSDPGNDDSAPVLTLIGDNPVNISVGTPYIDAGASAHDDIDGDLSGSISVDNGVNFFIAGTYTVTYSVSDSAGNYAEAVRTVNVN